MKKTLVFGLMLLFACSTPAFAKSSKKHVNNEANTATELADTTTDIAITSTEPETEQSLPSFPPRYSGENLDKILTLTKRMHNQLGKQDEFESSADYSSRKNQLSSKLSTGKKLTFVALPKQISSTYNPDKGLLTLDMVGKDQDGSGIEMRFNQQQLGSYIGTNSFGAKATIKKVRNHAVDLYDSENTLPIWGVIIDIVPNIAKEIKSNLAIAYTGTLQDSFYNVSEREWGAPTLSDPYELTSVTEYIHLKFTEVTVFNYKTGKIYKTFNLSELLPEWKAFDSAYKTCKALSQFNECGESSKHFQFWISVNDI